MVGRCIDEVADAVRISGGNSIPYDATGLLPGIYLIRINSGKAQADSKMEVLK
jgi:hypothetical protein